MDDRLRTGKSSWYVTSHPGQLSLAIPPWVGAMSTSKSWGVNRNTTRYTSPISVVSQCKLVSGWGLRKRRSAPPYGPCGSGRTLLLLSLMGRCAPSSPLDLALTVTKVWCLTKQTATSATVQLNSVHVTRRYRRRSLRPFQQWSLVINRIVAPFHNECHIKLIKNVIFTTLYVFGTFSSGTNYRQGRAWPYHFPSRKPKKYVLRVVYSLAVWKGILSVFKMPEKPLADGPPPRTPLGVLTALPRAPTWWGGGWLPLPNPTPLSALRASNLAPSGLAPCLSKSVYQNPPM